MKTKITEYAVTIIGLLLLAAGLCLLKMNGDPQGIMLALPCVCIGIGCGLFGKGMGNIISERAIRSNPEIQKELEIEKNDERNIAIARGIKGQDVSKGRINHLTDWFGEIDHLMEHLLDVRVKGGLEAGKKRGVRNFGKAAEIP